MINRIFNKSEFSRNIAILMKGTVIAQLIQVAATPLLSRIFTPEQFGIYAAFLGIISILVIFITLRLDFAILISKSKREMEHIIALSLFVSIFLIILMIPIFYFFRDILYQWTSKEIIDNYPFLFLTVIIVSFYQMIISINNREKKYNIMSKVKIQTSLLILFFTVLFGFTGFHQGQIYGYLLGTFISLFFLFQYSKGLINLKNIHFSKLILVLKKYQKFPKYSMPADIFNSFSNIGFPIVITIFFNPVVTGLYYFSNKIVKLPLAFIFSSISSVYTQKAGELYNTKKYKELYIFTKNTQKKLLFVLLPFCIIMFIISPSLFSIVFGAEWYDAGIYVRYYVIFVFFNGLYSPISHIGNILNKQDFLLYFNISLSCFMIASIAICSYIFSFEISILVSSITGSLHFIYLNLYMNQTLRRLK